MITEEQQLEQRQLQEMQEHQERKDAERAEAEYEAMLRTQPHGDKELRQIFRNEFDAYDTRSGIDSVVMAMTEDRFVEVVGKLLEGERQ